MYEMHHQNYPDWSEDGCLQFDLQSVGEQVISCRTILTYCSDDESASLFEEAGVQLRRYNPNKTSRLHIPISLH